MKRILSKIFTGIQFRRYLVSLALSLACISAQAFQDNEVTGRVTDSDTEETLPGTSVQIKGTTTGTITDANGEYRLNLPSENTTLVFSFVGYETVEINTQGRSTINISLTLESESLQEVVVVGYGVEKKVNLSGAVDNISADDIAKRPISNVSQGLQGMAPNLNIDFLSGEPGAAANINIRGLTSINGGNPLILIDNVPSSSQELNRLSPQDIESLSVIKDASAAAIYGARASFGVILITTKTGQKGMNISYSNNISWDKPTVLPNKVTDPYIYMRTLENSTDNTPWDYVNYTDDQYAYAKQRSENPESTPGVRVNPNDPSTWEYMGNKDWTREYLSDYSVSSNHQLAISGANDKASYYLSGSYNRQNGALNLAEDYFDRYTIRSKVDFNITDWMTLGNNTYLTNTQRLQPTYLNIRGIYDLFPTDWDVNPDGTYANTGAGRTAAQLTQGGDTDDQYTSLQSRFTAEMRFLDDDLKINSDFTYRRGNNNYNYHSTRYNIGYGPDDVRELGNNYAYRRANFTNYSVFNIYGTYNKSFGAHTITGILGFNQEYSRAESFYAEKPNVISASLPTIQLATGIPQVGESIDDWAIRGAFYRLNYNYADRYIVEFNGRYDGTSRFPKSKRFGFFPSASAAWRVSEESFMDNTSNIISNLKLRASYGSLGNQSVGSYGYIPTMSAYQSGYIINGARPLAVSPPQLVSANYTWETVETLNFGIDLGLLEDKINLNFDTYSRNTLGMLTQGRDLPDVLGAAEPNENAADLQTKGWELSVGYRNRVSLAGKPLNFSSRFILSDNQSIVTRFDNPNGNLTQFYEGMDFGEIWGLQSDGLFQSEEEISNLDQTSIIPWGALSIVPGWPKYQDLDNNGVIEKGLTLDDPKDLTVIGNITPRYRYGLDLSADWNGFDFRVLLQGIGQKDYYPLDYLYWGHYQQPYAGGYEHLLDYYRAEDDSPAERERHSQSYIDAGLAEANTDAEYPILQAWLADRNLGERIDQAEGLAIPQTKYLLSGAYLRVKNLTFGYTLPQSLLERVGIKSLRIYFSGENLGEVSELKEFYDPEAINDNLKYNPSESTSRGPGKGYAYPMMRRYAFGLNLNF